MGWTNRGKYAALNNLFRGGTLPTNFYVALVTSAAAPSATTNTLGDLTQIATGNGYSDGGFSLTPGATDFDSINEDDTNDSGSIQIKDVTWTAASGPIPSSGNGARYAVLTDDNGTIASREVWAYWDLSSDRTVSDGQDLTLQNLELRLQEPA